MAQRNIINERRDLILKYLDQNNTADISTLTDICNATEYTIRRDLIALEAQNKILRTHGGARKKVNEKLVWQVTSTNSRLEKNRNLKEAIAKEAAKLIHDNDSLIIDGGSTTQIFASYLQNKNSLLTVTTSPTIASIMLDSEDSHVILIGGELSKGTNMVSGSDAEEHLRKYFVDKCILAISAAEPDLGCYAAVPNEANIKKLMIEHARETIVLIDSTKFHRKAFSLAFSFNNISTVVTDAQIDKEIADKLRNKGINVIIAPL